MQTIEQLQQRFNPEAARDVNATYLIAINGQGGGSWLTKINDGRCEFLPYEGSLDGEPADCTISVSAEDLQLILDGRMSAMTAALSGVLAIDGELGLAMKLVPMFFQGQVPFI